MSTAKSTPREKDETIELREALDDPSTEWVPWEQVKDELRQLDEQESREKAEGVSSASAKTH